MKKTVKIIAAVLALVFALSLAACRKPDPKPVDPTNAPVNDTTEAPATEAPAREYDVDELAKAIREGCTFEDQYVEKIEDRDFILRYYRIDAATVSEKDGAKEVASYSAGSTPDLVLVLKANDEAGAKAALEAVQAMIDSYIENYTTYGPEQINKLETAVKIVKGQLLVVVISADNDAAYETVDKLLG
ncbi:MAG: DUF4358 domain-containing protein [Clostridiales bacterium]|nr:DUF4358 domain-containing protein [Clostridiales bacterium]